MSERLHDLLEQDQPSALSQVERALAAQESLTCDQDAVLGALIWRRCTGGTAGLLGCILNYECAQRIERLPEQLAHIGAVDASRATAELRDAIPLDAEQIGAGLFDWIETQPRIVDRARELNEGLAGIDETIWSFMKDAGTEIPDMEVPTRAESIVSSVFGLFRSNSENG